MDFIDSYKELFGVRRFAARAKLKPGTVVQFTYDNEQKYAMILNPEWEGKLHALSLKSLSPDGLKNLLRELSEEDNADAIYAKYKTSAYTETRPYRTYTLDKVRSLREIYLKTSRSATGELKTYSSVREFSSSELANEIGEYFENEYTLARFPNLASNALELSGMLSNASHRVLNKSELSLLENSDVGDVLRSNNPLKTAKKVAQQNDRDINRILAAIESNTALPMPIVIKHEGGYYLMAGNTRLCSMAGLGYTMPVKMLTYKKPESTYKIYGD